MPTLWSRRGIALSATVAIFTGALVSAPSGADELVQASSNSARGDLKVPSVSASSSSVSTSTSSSTVSTSSNSISGMLPTEKIPAARVDAMDPDVWRSGTALKLPGQGAFVAWIDPDTKPWASVLCVHGLGFSKDSFKDLGTRIARLGVATYALDVRGFGSYHKQDPKAPVDFELTFQDIQEALVSMRKANPDIPVYLMGESMGGAIALQSTSKYPELIDGAICSVPAFSVMRNMPEAFKIAGIAMTRGMNGEVSLKSTVVDRATVKQGVKNEVMNDPGTRKFLTVKDMLKYRKLMHANNKTVKRLTTTPVLFVQGFKDKLVGPRATTKMFNHVSTAFKDLNMSGNAEHLIFEEGQFNDETIDTLISWMNDHGYGGTPFAMLPSQISKLPSSDKLASLTRPGSVSAPASQHISGYKEHRTHSVVYSKDDGTTVTVTDSGASPKLGADSKPISSKYKIGKRFGTVDRPSVMMFFTPTTTISKEQEVLERSIQKLGKKINCLKQNTVDPEIREMAAEFGVLRFPTALIFDRNIEVIGYVNGTTDESLTRTELSRVVNKSAHSKRRKTSTELTAQK